MATVKQKLGQILFNNLPVSKEVFDIFRYEFRAFRVRVKNKLNPFLRSKLNKPQNSQELSVNVGAGPFGEEGWVNIELRKLNGVNLVYDIRKKIPFKSGSVERIRCEHVLEHMERNSEAPRFLEECHRVLKKGAIMRIVVPDIEKFIKAYYSKKMEEWQKIGFDIKNWETPVYILNHVFRQDGEHKFGYDFDSLKKMIEKYGFQVQKSAYEQSLDKKLQNDLENHRPYSLYVDCIKQ